MLKSVKRALRVATGHRFIDVLEDSQERLTIKALGCTTTVDRHLRHIAQNGRRVASIEAVKDVHLSQPMNHDGPPNWWISFRLHGGKRIELGSITDSTDASLIAAKLATVSGKPVRL